MDEALYACRFVQFAAAMVIFGAGWFRLYAFPDVKVAASVLAAYDPWVRRVTIAAAILALVSAVGLLLCQSAAFAASPAAAIDPATVIAVLLETDFGRIWFWRLIVAIFLVMACLGCRRGRDAVILIFSLLLLASLGWTGHAAKDEGAAGIAHEINQTVHLLAAGLWLGGLVPLAWLLRRAQRLQNTAEATLALGAVRHFSQMGYVAVALIALTGVINSLLLVSSFSAMVETPYGRLLAIKILLFLAMVVVALINRFYLAPRIARDAAVSRGLYRTIGVEQGLGLCVLAAVSVLGTLPPAVAGSGG